MMTQEKVLENLKMLIGRELDYDEVVGAFGDFKEGGRDKCLCSKKATVMLMII